MYIFFQVPLNFSGGRKIREKEIMARDTICVSYEQYEIGARQKKTKMINNPDLFTSGNEMFQSKFRKTG